MKSQFLLFSCALTFIVACAGNKPSGDLLEPVETGAKAKPEAGSTNSPAYERLTQVFKNLGYEAIGLQYESESTLDLLVRVFSDPRAEGKQVRLVYTGMHMFYDPRHESLTVGGTSDFDAIIGFIAKKVPAAKPKVEAPKADATPAAPAPVVPLAPSPKP